MSKIELTPEQQTEIISAICKRTGMSTSDAAGALSGMLDVLGTISVSATVANGPIEMRDYDYLMLSVDHEMVAPGDHTARVPAGTKLIRLSGGNGPGVRQKDGFANKASVDDYQPAPRA